MQALRKLFPTPVELSDISRVSTIELSLTRDLGSMLLRELGDDSDLALSFARIDLELRAREGERRLRLAQVVLASAALLLVADRYWWRVSLS